MIPKQCKRLAEVDFPIAAVSKHAARENSIRHGHRHGHPSTLHLWWARRPLASSRAVLLALLLPDPCDANCPNAFKVQARAALHGLWREQTDDDAALRAALLKFIADFANWDLAANQTYLQAARALVRAAHGDEKPLVVDPFAGGGSIPLEALRLGCDAFASDLNPVACLILKVMLEDIPRAGPELADELRKAGAEIKAAAQSELADLYPPDADGAQPIAYLWARTVQCESPVCGAEIPLLRSFWLCENERVQPHRKIALRPKVTHSDGKVPSVEFSVFNPVKDSEVQNCTVTGAQATCVVCKSVLARERVQAQLVAQNGCTDVVFSSDGTRTGGPKLLAVVKQLPNETRRDYRPATDEDYAAVRLSQQRFNELLSEWESTGKSGLCPVPDEPLPPVGTPGLRVQRYGMKHWGDLFTARQKVVLACLTNAVIKFCAGSSIKNIENVMALSLGKVIRHCNVSCKWHRGSETVAGAIGMNAIPMPWDFPEMFPLAKFAGGVDSGQQDVIGPVQRWLDGSAGRTQLADAVDVHCLDNDAADVWFTDPPYYDAIPYADLSDFFFVWLKRALPNHKLLRDQFEPDNPLTPKLQEAVQDRSRMVKGMRKDGDFYERAMAKAFAEGRRILGDDGIASVVFAHKTTEGWEALLSGLIRGRWTITGSWPIATERGARLRAHGTASLATSVHLICRPRPDNAGPGAWEKVVKELPDRVREWMQRLQGEGIRGADLVFACIGPALEIFSRYARVVTPDDTEITLPQYLEKVWAEVSTAALQQVLGGGGELEEDARLTALFLWTLQGAANGGDGDTENGSAKGGFSLPFDVVRRIAQSMGIDLPALQERKVFAVNNGVVRLLPAAARREILLGNVGMDAAADWIERDPDIGRQDEIFSVEDAGSAAISRRADSTLDRIHIAMLLHKHGKSAALRQHLETQRQRDGNFMRLANALSMLYPGGSEEKRVLDAVLVVIK